jgi:predicted nucleotidyltransferase
MWIPMWLGEIYSKLFISFETELFTLSQAEEALEIDGGKLSVAFSKLHSKRVLTIFRRSKPRVYRLLDPSSFILLASEKAKNVERLKQERYLSLILKGLQETLKRFRVQSFAIYGSVARGVAEDISDIDILLVSDDFQGSMGSRIEQLLSIDDALQEELRWLRGQGIYTGLSFYPLRPREAETLPNLFLDLTEDAVILYDEDRFLEGLLLELKAKLLRSGAVRVLLGRDRWYWDLKPNYKYGEAVEIH